MSDISGVSADHSPAPEIPVDVPNPVTTEHEGHAEPDAKPEGKPEKGEKPEAKAEKADKPVSIDDALKRAREKVEKDNAPVKIEDALKPRVMRSAEKSDTKDAKAEDKTEPKRDETGKFAPKDDANKADTKNKDAEAQKLLDWAKSQTKDKSESRPSYTADDAPARVASDVKDLWHTLPHRAREEWTRMHSELTQGYEKHKAGAERDAQLNEFHEMAKQSGKQLPQVLREYVNMENHLRKDLVGGLNEICSRVGVSLKDVAAHIMGQTPDQNASAQDATIRELKAEIAELKGQVGHVSQTFQQQREQSTLQEVTKFAQDNPRFEELSEDIAFFMKSGRAKDLSEAYTLAERLNPAPKPDPASKPAASSAPDIDLSVQTEKGQKSIQGSPTPGSDPVRRPPSKSIEESIRRAMAQAG